MTFRCSLDCAYWQSPTGSQGQRLFGDWCHHIRRHSSVEVLWLLTCLLLLSWSFGRHSICQVLKGVMRCLDTPQPTRARRRPSRIHKHYPWCKRTSLCHQLYQGLDGITLAKLARRSSRRGPQSYRDTQLCGCARVVGASLLRQFWLVWVVDPSLVFDRPPWP